MYRTLFWSFYKQQVLALCVNAALTAADSQHDFPWKLCYNLQALCATCRSTACMPTSNVCSLTVIYYITHLPGICFYSHLDLELSSQPLCLCVGAKVTFLYGEILFWRNTWRVCHTQGLCVHCNNIYRMRTYNVPTCASSTSSVSALSSKYTAIKHLGKSLFRS